MAKLFCLLNNHNRDAEEHIISSLDYNPRWQKKVYQDEDITLGCLELPFKREDDFWLERGDFVIVLDGEIFAWPEPLQGKTTMEMVLILFEESKQDLVRHINGNFSLIVWNKKQRILSIMNDRMGLRPLYYAQYKNKTFFASEIKAIISDIDFRKKLNIEGVIDLFTYEYIFEDRTLIDNVRVVPYASTIRLSKDENKLNFKKYWDFNFKEDGFLYGSRNEYLDKFKELIIQTVKRNMKGDLKIGVPLSGGLDSRAILAMIEKKYYPLHTFTFGEKGCEDEKYAMRISKILGTKHHYAGIKFDRLAEFMKKGVFYCDGLVSCTHYHIFNILDEMQQYVNVALDGFLGGALPRSIYTKYYGRDKATVFSAFDTFKEEARQRIFSKDLNKEIERGKNRFFTLYEDIRIKNKENPVDYLNLTQRQRRFINYGKIHMRNYVETRMPFADYDYMDFCIEMPKYFKINGKIYKELLISYFSKFARIPQHGQGLSLTANRYEKALDWRIKSLKRKIGITAKKTYNYKEWYRTVLRDFISSTLLSQKFKDRQLFNFQEVQKLLNEHFQGDKNYEIQIGVLLTFELWCRLFLDGEAI